MKYFLIAGEASGDLHTAHLMQSLREEDAEAEFRFYGGDKMQAVGGELLCHYRHLAYMGVVPVLLHARTILRGMKKCKEEILSWHPDAVILVDYPGFNLKIARYVAAHRLCPVFYYISPKVWAWKERRVRAIKRDVTRLFSILPFETAYFHEKHQYEISYVGNPTLDEVQAYKEQNGDPQPEAHTLALLPGSRQQEARDNLSRMLQACAPLGDYQLVVAAAPALDAAFYERIIRKSGVDARRVSLVRDETYALLSRATAALVTSGTATLETALFGVPQVVCYFMRPPRLVRFFRPYFLKVPYISLVNLIAGREVVPELVGADMCTQRVRQELEAILPQGEKRAEQLRGYTEVLARLGEKGAPAHAAREMVDFLRAAKK